MTIFGTLAYTYKLKNKNKGLITLNKSDTYSNPSEMRHKERT